MKPLRIIAFVPIACLLLSGLALAHSVSLWAYFEKGKVHVEGFFGNGNKVQDAQVVVLDKDGKKLLEGKTDSDGKFSFDPPNKEALTILLISDQGHRAEFKMTAEDFKEEAPASK